MTLVAALILGKVAFGEQGLVFPLIVTAIGALTAALGVYITRVRGTESGLAAIYRGFYTSALAGALLAAVAAFVYLPSTFAELNGVGEALADHTADPRVVATLAVAIGIVLAGVILWLTGYFTGTTSKPTLHVARTSLTGAATVVLSGIGVGFESAVYTAGIIAAAICGVFLISGGSIVLSLFLIALAGCGLLTTVGVIVAMDTFGPVSDNAQGIAEMSGDVDAEGAQILTDLDAVGNTTKAITKGIAIATAVLAATALFGSYTDAVRQAVADLGAALDTSGTALAMISYEVISPITLVGVILGAATVFLFSGLAIDAVTRAAGAIVFEVRRQFREMPGIMTGEVRPEYGRVVDICTRDSLRELATPGLLAAFAPIAVGFGLGVGPLAGFLAGAIAAGVLMAVFLANSGGAWDNAKKIVEDGRYGGKNSDAHAAVVIGDTVGDPFKDTAGPAINPLIKVMNLVALLIAPAVVQVSLGADANHALRLAIATVAALIAFGAVIVSRLRAALVDREGRLAHEAHLVSVTGPGGHLLVAARVRPRGVPISRRGRPSAAQDLHEAARVRALDDRREPELGVRAGVREGAALVEARPLEVLHVRGLDLLAVDDRPARDREPGDVHVRHDQVGVRRGVLADDRAVVRRLGDVLLALHGQRHLGHLARVLGRHRGAVERHTGLARDADLRVEVGDPGGREGRLAQRLDVRRPLALEARGAAALRGLRLLRTPRRARVRAAVLVARRVGAAAGREQEQASHGEGRDEGTGQAHAGLQGCGGRRRRPVGQSSFHVTRGHDDAVTGSERSAPGRDRIGT